MYSRSARPVATHPHLARHPARGGIAVPDRGDGRDQAVPIRRLTAAEAALIHALRVWFQSLRRGDDRGAALRRHFGEGAPGDDLARSLDAFLTVLDRLATRPVELHSPQAALASADELRLVAIVARPEQAGRDRLVTALVPCIGAALVRAMLGALTRHLAEADARPADSGRLFPEDARAV